MFRNSALSSRYIITESMMHKMIVLFYSVIAILGSIIVFKLHGIDLYIQCISGFLFLFTLAMMGYLGIRMKPILIIPIVYFLLRSFNSYDTIYSSYIEMLVYIGLAFLGALKVGGFLLIEKKDQQSVYKLYYSYLVTVSILGIIAVILFLLKIPVYRILPYYQGGGYYFDFGFSLLLPRIVLPRLCGLFSEPGQMGTILAFALCIENFDYKRKTNIVLFVAGCLTFSLAFFAIFVTYMALTSFQKLHFVVLLSILLCVSTGFIAVNTIDMPDVQKLLRRMEVVDGKLVGDDRSTPQIDGIFTEILDGVQTVWGYGSGYCRSLRTGSWSIKMIFIDHGLLGGFLYFLFPLVFSILFSYKVPRAMAFVACFFLSSYQRTEIYSLSMLILLFGGIEYIKNQEILKHLENTC